MWLSAAQIVERSKEVLPKLVGSWLLTHQMLLFPHDLDFVEGYMLRHNIVQVADYRNIFVSANDDRCTLLCPLLPGEKVLLQTYHIRTVNNVVGMAKAQ